MSRSRPRQRADRDERTEVDEQSSPGEGSPPKKKQRKSQSPNASRPYRWHPAARAALSLLLIVHLTAVFVAPWRLSTLPALPPGYVAFDQQGHPRPDLPPPPMDHPAWQEPVLISRLYQWLRPYMNLTFINHGYEFFAPDPAPSSLIRITLKDADENSIKVVKLPDRGQQWPRLFYHRHMMLASQASDPVLGQADVYRLYAQRLLREYGGVRAIVERSVHMLLSPEMVLSGRHINATDTYDASIPVIEVYPEQQPGSQATSTRSSEPRIRIPGNS